MNKEAHILPDDSNLRYDQYALIIKEGNNKIKLFPVDNKEHTIESANLFIDHVYDFGEKEQKTAATLLKSASALWGVPIHPVIEDLADTFIPGNVVEAETVKEHHVYKEASHGIFALEDRYPIDSPALIKEACRYMDAHWREFDPTERRVFSKNVKSASVKMKTTVTPLIEKLASDSYDDNLGMHLHYRASLSEKNIADKYHKLASYRYGVTPDEFVDLLFRLDKKAGLDKSYNKDRILDPTMIVFGIEKKAEQSFEVDGKTFTATQLKKALANPEIISIFGETTINGMMEHPEIFDSMPLPERQLIASKVKDA